MEDIQSPLPSREIYIPEEKPVTSTRVEINDNTTIPQKEAHQKEHKIKKIFPLIIGVLLLLGIILAISFIRKNLAKKIVKQADVQLNYWGIWEENSVMESIIADFEAKNPGIKVKYKKNVQTDYRTRLKSRLSKTGVEEDVPDIFRIHASWIPMFRDELASVPVLTADAIGFETDFYDVYKRDLKVGNNLKAIPLMYDGLALFYNKDLLEQSGGSIPKTWNDLRSMAEKIVKRDDDGRIVVAGVAAGLIDNVDHWSDIVGLMLQQSSIDPIKNSDDKKLGDVLTYYTLLKTKYNLWDETLPPSTQMFASGKLGFYFGPAWRIFDIENLNPNLRYEITTVPQLELPDGQKTNIKGIIIIEANLLSLSKGE